ncbi:carboxyvinyl-carboxyphosphonate phosphorylmutase [Acuticoccus sediminis]|uniref:Carboxyvinyl-carboxyphosphonate phosphorylmutase n=1 Tax=Acuticoccus sediminis TaxID=2184697 RepID=A0A8B2P1D5_9HYPH|nr:isocitrate lyase/PEP mutase family protein [Acuticoccus sediminis]RAI02087.1 carboxyvinyl-carboxyphosphonate phosphorylmutase [Acuticoccus sediminis]
MRPDPATRRARLRDRLASGELIVAPGACNGLGASLVERAGFEAVYMTGSGVANALTGKADVGLLSLTEMAMMVRFMTHATPLPVIADADNGYGNAINVVRTVEEYEAAGVTALHIEDQVVPKRCGSIAGKVVVPADEMEGKIRAACDARSDPNLVIIARTDARAAHGLDEAIGRGRRYAAAGADVIFPDALLSEAEYARFAAEVPGPKLLNMGGYARKRTTPKIPLETVAAMGYAIVLFPLASIRAAVAAELDFLHGLRARGTQHEIEHLDVLDGHPVENWYEFTGISEVRALEDRYLPAADVAARYANTAGHRPGDT